MKIELFELLSGITSSAYLTSEKSYHCTLEKVRGKSQLREGSDLERPYAPGGCGLPSLDRSPFQGLLRV